MKLPRFNLNKILLYYSTFLITALMVAGILLAKATNEIVSNILLLPVVIFLWITVIQQFMAAKKTKEKELETADNN